MWRNILPSGCIVLFSIFVSISAVFGERKVMEKPEVKITVTPRSLEQRLIGAHPKTGEKLYEPDREPGVEFDEVTGNFIYHYKSRDGKQTFYVAWEPSTKIDVIVKTTVDFHPKSKRYKYNYDVINLPTSRQNLSKFFVEYGASIYSSSSPPHLPLGEPGEWWSEPTINGGYYPGPSKKKLWYWVDVPHKRFEEGEDIILTEETQFGPTRYPLHMLLKSGIPPGKSQDGFSLESAGLPGIVDCYMQGKVKHYIWPERPPLEFAGTKPKFFQDSVSGRTIGLVTIPEPLIPEDFVEYIISLSTESFYLGWIEKSEVFEELVNRLGAVKQTLIKEDKRKAKSMLGSFLEYLESQKDKYLLSEAYALLKFNTKYLLEHL